MRLALALLLAVAGCATPRLVAPKAAAYGEVPAVSPDEGEVALYEAVDAALGEGGLPPARRDPAVLAATRARCNLMGEGGRVPTPPEIAETLNEVGVADVDYQVVDEVAPYARRSLDPKDLTLAARKLGKNRGSILAGVCTLPMGSSNQRAFAVTLVNRGAELRMARTMERDADLDVSAVPETGVSDLTFYAAGLDGKLVGYRRSSMRVQMRLGPYPGNTQGFPVVVEVVGTVGARREILSRGAFVVGGPPQSFPHGKAPNLKDAAGVATLLEQLLRGARKNWNPAAMKLAQAELDGVSGGGFAARAQSAGLKDVVLLTGRVGRNDLSRIEVLWSSSPYLGWLKFRDSAMAVVARDVPGGVAYAIVVEPDYLPAP